MVGPVSQQRLEQHPERERAGHVDEKDGEREGAGRGQHEADSLACPGAEGATHGNEPDESPTQVHRPRSVRRGDVVDLDVRVERQPVRVASALVIVVCAVLVARVSHALPTFARSEFR